VAIYLLIAVAVLLKDAMDLERCCSSQAALCGWLYVRYAPRRGVAFGFGEQYFGCAMRTTAPNGGGLRGSSR